MGLAVNDEIRLAVGQSVQSYLRIKIKSHARARPKN